MHGAHGAAPARGVPAVFLDRDGTLNEEVEGALREPSQLVLYAGAGAALAELKRSGYRLVVCTNQSALARGWLTPQELEAVHAELCRRLAEEGADLDEIRVCPHHPDEGDPPLRRRCGCRKPAPGMLLAAARSSSIDLARSWVLGDAERDLEAGAAIGVRGILIGTGKGRRELERLAREGRRPLFAEDLRAAVRLLLACDAGLGPKEDTPRSGPRASA
jgi:histidinol-phosphate phosphatase family protein